MKSLRLASIIACLFLLLGNTVQAAQDYNSSRSNRQGVSDVGDGADTLLKEASADASSVVKSMIAVDQKDGYTGEYDITVDVRISIERVVSPRDAASGMPTGKR